MMGTNTTQCLKNCTGRGEKVGVIRSVLDWMSKRSFNWVGSSYFNYGSYLNDENILKSSDTYNLMKLISDQVALAEFDVEDIVTGKNLKTRGRLMLCRFYHAQMII